MHCLHGDITFRNAFWQLQCRTSQRYPPSRPSPITYNFRSSCFISTDTLRLRNIISLLATMTLSAIPRCSYCDIIGSDSKLFLCQACRVVHYCGRDHQVAHRENHKQACKAIKKSQTALDREETKLRSHPGDFMTPPNLFEEHAGHFWGIMET